MDILSDNLITEGRNSTFINPPLSTQKNNESIENVGTIISKANSKRSIHNQADSNYKLVSSMNELINNSKQNSLRSLQKSSGREVSSTSTHNLEMDENLADDVVTGFLEQDSHQNVEKSGSRKNSNSSVVDIDNFSFRKEEQPSFTEEHQQPHMAEFEHSEGFNNFDDFEFDDPPQVQNYVNEFKTESEIVDDRKRHENYVDNSEFIVERDLDAKNEVDPLQDDFEFLEQNNSNPVEPENTDHEFNFDLDEFNNAEEQFDQTLDMNNDQQPQYDELEYVSVDFEDDVEKESGKSSNSIFDDFNAEKTDAVEKETISIAEESSGDQVSASFGESDTDDQDSVEESNEQLEDDHEGGMIRNFSTLRQVEDSIQQLDELLKQKIRKLRYNNSHKPKGIWEPTVRKTGIEFSRQVAVESIANKLIQEQRAESNQLNRLLLLRLTNPWSSIKNSEILFPELYPKPPKKRYIAATSKTQPPPLSEKATEYYRRLSAPSIRPIPPNPLLSSAAQKRLMSSNSGPSKIRLEKLSQPRKMYPLPYDERKLFMIKKRGRIREIDQTVFARITRHPQRILYELEKKEAQKRLAEEDIIRKEDQYKRDNDPIIEKESKNVVNPQNGDDDGLKLEYERKSLEHNPQIRFSDAELSKDSQELSDGKIQQQSEEDPSPYTKDHLETSYLPQENTQIATADDSAHKSSKISTPKSTSAILRSESQLIRLAANIPLPASRPESPTTYEDSEKIAASKNDLLPKQNVKSNPESKASSRNSLANNSRSPSVQAAGNIPLPDSNNSTPLQRNSGTSTPKKSSPLSHANSVKKLKVVPRTESIKVKNEEITRKERSVTSLRTTPAASRKHSASTLLRMATKVPLPPSPGEESNQPSGKNTPLKASRTSSNQQIQTKPASLINISVKGTNLSLRSSKSRSESLIRAANIPLPKSRPETPNLSNTPDKTKSLSRSESRKSIVAKSQSDLSTEKPPKTSAKATQIKTQSQDLLAAAGVALPASRPESIRNSGTATPNKEADTGVVADLNIDAKNKSEKVSPKTSGKATPIKSQSQVLIAAAGVALPASKPESIRNSGTVTPNRDADFGEVATLNIDTKNKSKLSLNSLATSSVSTPNDESNILSPIFHEAYQSVSNLNLP
ncbi:hypothetical protein HK098_000487 [Nowakowskiella sp. JEL0407]|nr:hypothetical protein HK098_000487 [Nowakowskiella sp. JEL0407]